MSSLPACNVKYGFLYLVHQHKEVRRMTFAEKLKTIRKQVYHRQGKTKLGSEKLFEVTDQILQDNIKKGNLK